MSEVRIIHERFTVLGGAEKVTLELARAWPSAKVFCAVADDSSHSGQIASARIETSWLQRVRRTGIDGSILLAALPLAMRSLDLTGADLVVASHYAFANRVRVPDQAKFLSYVHTPARWMWDRDMREMEFTSRMQARSLGVYARTQRGADRRAAARPDLLIANSCAVAERIEKYWKRSAQVMHPPAQVDFFTPDDTVEREPFFLLAGRQVPYKRPEVAVMAASLAGVRLVVVGEGRSLEACRRLAGPTVEFRGSVDDDTLRDLYRRTQALVFPGVEDFGIVPVEAQACGTVVIGVDQGGVRDTVRAGTTGELLRFHRDIEVQARLFADVMSSFSAEAYDSKSVRAHALAFGPERFRAGILSAAERL